MKNGLLICSGTGKYKNIGDYIQSLAAELFFDHIDILVERERLNEYISEEKTKVILNGWFMWNPLNWPPSKNILPFFISYTLNAIRDISIVSDTDLFGILSGEDLSRCFVLAVPLDHPYSCMIFSDKEAGAYRSGISIDEYLRMEPMFAGPVCFRFAEEYADMIEAETVCRFTVALVLDNGSTVEGVSAGYRLIPSCGTCQR